MTSSPGAESMACLDRALRIRQMNQEFSTRFGMTPDDEFSRLVHPSLRQAVCRGLTGLAEGRRHRFSTQVVLVDATGAPSPAMLTAVSVCDAGGVTTVLVVLRPAPDGDAEVVTGCRKILSEMDARILEGIAAGTSTIPLASRLYLSRQGVEYRVSGLLRKLKVPNRAALVSRAYSMGVLNVGSWPPKVVDDFVK